MCFSIGTTAKLRRIRKKHNVSFAEAATTFSDPHAIEFLDENHSEIEERWVLVGLFSKTRVLIVVFVEREEGLIRILSARKAVRSEADQYFARILV